MVAVDRRRIGGPQTRHHRKRKCDKSDGGRSKHCRAFYAGPGWSATDISWGCRVRSGILALIFFVHTQPAGLHAAGFGALERRRVIEFPTTSRAPEGRWPLWYECLLSPLETCLA